MPYIKVGKENAGDIDLYYEDHGTGKPVGSLIHGYPLSGASWEKQPRRFSPRVIVSSRTIAEGCGKPPARGSVELRHLSRRTLIKNRDQARTTRLRVPVFPWEAAKWPVSGSSPRVLSKAVFISSVPPLLKTPDNPEGVDGSVFEGIQKAVAADRYASPSSSRTSITSMRCWETRPRANHPGKLEHRGGDTMPSQALPACRHGTKTFRKDLAYIDVPTLVIHGDADRILPISAWRENGSAGPACWWCERGRIASPGRTRKK